MIQPVNVQVDSSRADKQCSHRDIKPKNLFRRGNGVWAIGDFGLVDFPGKEDITEASEADRNVCPTV